MAETLRPVMQRQALWEVAWWFVPAAVFGLPLLAAMWLGVAQAADVSAWSALLGDTQFAPALRLSLWTGTAASLLALMLTVGVVTRLHGTRHWHTMQAALSPVLAVPHAAFAVGLALLLMPSGWLSRCTALLMGWQSPPDVATVQDPWGLSLIFGLVLKELPFLLLNVMAQFQKVGQGAELERHLQVAASLGYSAPSTWLRVLWPQLLPRLALPLLAVWAYSFTVVDMALVLGPTRPPTLAVLAWQWLQDSSDAVNRQGAAAALFLTVAMVVAALLCAASAFALRGVLTKRWTRGDRPLANASAASWSAALAALLASIYPAVLALLLFTSLVGVWRYPSLWPSVWTDAAWQAVAQSFSTLQLTAGLAVLSAISGLILAVAWMETTAPHFDRYAPLLACMPLLVPGVLLVSGLYQLTLWWRVDGTVWGLWLAHTIYTAPYVWLALAPAYRSFDVRLEQTSHALGRSHAAFLWRVKWPMLSAPLASAFAVGFAVSVTQYLSTQFIAAGRLSTVTTEALTLASGGQRNVAAAFALLQALLPACVFAAAWWMGKQASARGVPVANTRMAMA
jgi:putative thiamine transport system permease protein